MLARQLNYRALCKLAEEASASIAGMSVCLSQCELGDLEAVRESVGQLCKAQGMGRWECLLSALDTAIISIKQAMGRVSPDEMLLAQAAHFAPKSFYTVGKNRRIVWAKGIVQRRLMKGKA